MDLKGLKKIKEERQVELNEAQERISSLNQRVEAYEDQIEEIDNIPLV